MQTVKKKLSLYLVISALLLLMTIVSGNVTYAATLPHSATQTISNNNQPFIHIKTITNPRNIHPRGDPTGKDCITLWGQADSIRTFGPVVSYNVRTNLWNTCGTALDGTSVDPTIGWTAQIDTLCDGQWITQKSINGPLPDLADLQQVLPLFYYNFKSSCIDATGNVTTPEGISILVAATSVRVDNGAEVTGGVDITVL